MSKDEFKLIWKILIAAYDNFKTDIDKFNVWYSMLKDISYDALCYGIKEYIKTNKYPPTISDMVTAEQSYYYKQLEHRIQQQSLMYLKEV